jgi:trimethylamine--corrinoid protein Co-methyltransferase
VCDAQSGHEKTLTGLLAALAGANLIYGPGMIESGMTFDYGQIVMDNEFAKMIKFAVGGIPVNDATLCVDLIREIGPFKDYLAHKNTFEHMRTYPHPKIMDRRMRGNWESDGALDMHAKAMLTARKILAEHRPAPLPEAVLAEIRSLVAEAEKELGVGPRKMAGEG